MNATQCTPRSPITQPAGASVFFKSKFLALRLFELRIALDKFLRAAPGEAHGYAAVFVVALDSNDGANAEAWMTHFAPQHGIGVGAAFCSGARDRGLSCGLAARSCVRWLRFTAHTAKEFVRRIRILRVWLVAALFANFRHGTAYRVHQLAWNFREKTRGQGSAQLLLIAEDTPVHGASQCERLPRACHSHVNETPFLFDSFFFCYGAAVRAHAFFPAGEEYVIEFQALSAVQGDESYAGLAFKLVRVTHQRRGIEEIGEGLSGFHGLGDGAR